MARYKRKNFFIKKDLQGRYIFGVFMTVVLATVLFYLLFSFFMADTLSISYEDYNLELGTSARVLFGRYLGAQWIFLVVGGIVVAFLTMRYTHRVAGPIYRFEKALEEMKAGDFSSRIVLRDRDELKEIADSFNAVNRGLSARIEGMRAAAADVNSALLEAEREAEPGAGGERIREALEANRRLEEQLKAFTIGK